MRGRRVRRSCDTSTRGIRLVYAATMCEEGVHADGVETARSFGTGVDYVGLLFDKEATTFFYNCVFNLMDSLMRFVVLRPAR